MTLFIQYLSLLGASLILVAYWGHQRGWMDSKGTSYNVLNAVGAAILAYVAQHPFQAGFFILECIWVGLSVIGLYKILKKPTAF